MTPAENPLLTAAAVDTLSVQEQARLGGLIASTPQARATLEEIRAQADALRKEYEEAPKPPPPAPADDLFAPQHREALDAVTKTAPAPSSHSGARLWGMLGGAAAAALALVLGLHAHRVNAPQAVVRHIGPVAAVPPVEKPIILPPPVAVAPPPPAPAPAPPPPPTPFPDETAPPESEADRAPELAPTGPGPMRLTPGPMHATAAGAPPGFTLPEFVPVSTPGPAPDASGAVTQEGPGFQSSDFGAAQAAKTAPLPFTLMSRVVPSPLDPSRQLLVVGMQAVRPAQVKRPRANLVFLVDDSITMGGADRLPVFKQAFAQFLNRLDPEDRVSLVVYAGDSALLLPPTPAQQKAPILAAFTSIAPVASGHPGASLQIAYDVAHQNLVPGGFNRIIAVTDGDLNLGVGETGGLYDYVTRQAHDGITLSVLGVGREFAASAMAKKLIAAGLGRASATRSEDAVETALDQEIATPPPAKVHDVKMEIALSPETAAAYRLVGYQNHLPLAGSGLSAEAGAGILAVYEIEPLNHPGPIETRIRYHRSYPEAPEEILSQTVGAPASAPAENLRSFDEQITGIEAQLASLPKHEGAPAPVETPPAAVTPNPDPEQAGSLTPRAVRDFQQNAGAWIEPGK